MRESSVNAEVETPNLSTIDNCTFDALFGGTIVLPAVTTVTFDDLENQWEWESQDVGSNLEFPNLETIKITDPFTNLAMVTVTSGTISLPALERVQLPEFPSNPVIFFDNASGEILLPQLQTLDWTRIELSEQDGVPFELPMVDGTVANLELDLYDGRAISLPEVTELSRTTFDIIEGRLTGGKLRKISGSSSFNLSSQEFDLDAPVEELDDVNFSLRSQGALRFDDLTTASKVLVGIRDEALLEMPNIQSLSARDGQNLIEARDQSTFRANNLETLTLPENTQIAARNLSIFSENEAVIEMRGLKTLNGGELLALDRGTLHLDSLTSITNSRIKIGGTGDNDNATINLPNLEEYTGETGRLHEIEVNGENANLNAPNLFNIDQAYIRVSADAMLTLPNVTDYTVQLGNSAELLFEVSGEDSLLALPNVQTMDIAIPGNSNATNAIDATDGSELDLSAVSTIDVRSGNLEFEAEGANTVIHLNALMNFDASRLTFTESNGGTIMR